MNASMYAIIYLLIHKIFFSCYLPYTLPSEIKPFSQRLMFLAFDLMVKSLKNRAFAVFVPIYK